MKDGVLTPVYGVEPYKLVHDTTGTGNVFTLAFIREYQPDLVCALRNLILLGGQHVGSSYAISSQFFLVLDNQSWIDFFFFYRKKIKSNNFVN
jgi:hypothetical protein